MVRASGLRTVQELSKEALGVHPRAKLTVLGRRLLVERIVVEGWPVARAAEAQGVSLATAYKWVRRWRVEGEAGLVDRSCRPHTSPRRLPAARERAILAWRHTHRVGPHRIGWALGEAPPRCMRCCAVTSCPGCGNWTARPGRRCATSATGRVNWSMSISSPKVGSPRGWASAAGTWPGRRQP